MPSTQKPGTGVGNCSPAGEPGGLHLSSTLASPGGVENWTSTALQTINEGDAGHEHDEGDLSDHRHRLPHCVKPVVASTYPAGDGNSLPKMEKAGTWQ